MLRLYYSLDQGLLDHEAYRFISEHENVEHVRGFNAADLELLLIQKNLDGNIDNLIVEHYEGSLDVLDNILNYSGVKNVLVLYLAKELSASIKKSLMNKGWKIDEIPKLHNQNKNNFFEKVLKLRYPNLKISERIRAIIKSEITSRATDINAFVENMASLDSTGDLNEKTVLGIARFFQKDLNLFSFLPWYLKNDLRNWIGYIDTVITCDDTYLSFLYSFSKQLFELKQYITLRSKGLDSKEIDSITKIKYAISKYEPLLNKYGSRLIKWLDNFIIEWYIVQFSLVHPCSVNCILIKWFLLKQRRMLTNTGKIDCVG